MIVAFAEPGSAFHPFMSLVPHLRLRRAISLDDVAH